MSRLQSRRPFARLGTVLLATLMLPVAAQGAGAQTADTIRVEQKALPFAVRTGLVEDEMFLESNGATTRGPKSTKETREVACGAAQCFQVVMITVTPRGPMTDSVWMDRRSLALVRHVEVGFGNRTEVVVANGRIKGAAVDTAKAVRNIDAAAPAFDFSVLEEIVSGLPLKAGYTATLHTFDVTRGFRDVGVTVRGQESLETSRGRRDSWIVDIALGTHTATRWIDKETRAGLKWQVDVGGGRRMWGQSVER